MEPTGTDPQHGFDLLCFYECLTDPKHLDTLMEMVTSWLEDIDAKVVAPKIDYHADQAWRLLGELSSSENQSTNEDEAFEHSRFDQKSDVQAALKDQIVSEDFKKLDAWLEAETNQKTLLLRLATVDFTELVMLSRDPKDGTYLFKHTGPKFQTLISQFVAESFGLTNAEVSLVQELLSGGTLREIAVRLGKSWETTRSQVKTLTNKLGVSSQSDILRVVHQAANLMPAAISPNIAANDGNLKKIIRPDGRTLTYAIDGPRSDKTLVYLHGMIQGLHWPDKARRYANDRGWRVVRIGRAGIGVSSVNPKEKSALLQDHVDDVIAVMDQEEINTFSIFGAADGFAIGYATALQNPERVRKIVGLEVVPPILSHKDISGFVGKMKTYGLACLYAPKTVRFMLKIALRSQERQADRYSEEHPLMDVELSKIEDADGIRAHERNFRDLMDHHSEGMWRDSTISTLDWAHAPQNTNIRPSAALIHCGNSLVKPSGLLDAFAHRIGAPIYHLDSYLPYVSAPLPLILDTLEPT